MCERKKNNQPCAGADVMRRYLLRKGKHVCRVVMSIYNDVYTGWLHIKSRVYSFIDSIFHVQYCNSDKNVLILIRIVKKKFKLYSKITPTSRRMIYRFLILGTLCIFFKEK